MSAGTRRMARRWRRPERRAVDPHADHRRAVARRGTRMRPRSSSSGRAARYAVRGRMTSRSAPTTPSRSPITNSGWGDRPVYSRTTATGRPRSSATPQRVRPNSRSSRSHRAYAANSRSESRNSRSSSRSRVCADLQRRAEHRAGAGEVMPSVGARRASPIGREPRPGADSPACRPPCRRRGASRRAARSCAGPALAAPSPSVGEQDPHLGHEGRDAARRDDVRGRVVAASRASGLSPLRYDAQVTRRAQLDGDGGAVRRRPGRRW